MIIKRSLTILSSDGVKTIATAQSVVVCNLGFFSIYVGDRSVTAVDGFEIAGGKAYSFDLVANEPLYGLAPNNADLLVLQTMQHQPSSVPTNIDLAAELGGEILFVHQADVVTNVNQLPSNPSVGRLAQLQIGTWPSVEIIDLICYQDPTSLLKYWVSEPGSLITQADQGYMGSNTTTDDYIDTNASGTTTGIMGWTTRSIRRASEILAAGLQLQSNMTAILAGSNLPAAFSILSYFWQHNSGDQVVFSSDGSTRDGEGTPLVSNTDNLTRLKTTGWNNVVKKATSAPLDATAITKTNLWPRLYGRVVSGTNYGSEIDADLQYRWYCLAS